MEPLAWSEEQMNVEHRTSNIEHRMGKGGAPEVRIKKIHRREHGGHGDQAIGNRLWAIGEGKRSEEQMNVEHRTSWRQAKPGALE